MASAAPSTTVKSALRTLDIIELVVAHPEGMVAQDLAAALSIPVSSLSYLLSTLTERDYLLRSGRRYLPGPGLARLRARPADLSLAERVTPLVRAIRSELDETASFMVRDGWEVSALVTAASAQALRYAIEPGTRKPLHSLAAGKAILAALPEPELARYLAEAPRTAFTAMTVTDADALRRSLAEIASTGLAEAHEENTTGICGLACVARGPDKAVLGALAVAIPTARFTPELAERAKNLLLRNAAVLASN